MVDHILFTLGTILRPLEVALGASAPFVPSLYANFHKSVSAPLGPFLGDTSTPNLEYGCFDNVQYCSVLFPKVTAILHVNDTIVDLSVK